MVGADLEAIVPGISEKFRATHQIERVARILSQHGLAMRQVAIRTYTHVCIRRLGVWTQIHTASTMRQSIPHQCWRGCQRNRCRGNLWGTRDQAYEKRRDYKPHACDS